MTPPRTHAFTNDLLADHDAVALAALLRRGELSRREIHDAMVARAQKVGALNAIEHAMFEQPVSDPAAGAGAVFAGVPMFIKDNVEVAGAPTRYGSRAVRPEPARGHSAVTQLFLGMGFSITGKSRLPEFGFSPSAEFESWEPTRNPWNPAYSSGASSGGAAALVAAGVVPMGHANDGGGSIRIPAACCGLVGLKSTRGRLINGEMARGLPLNIVSEGVVTRTVRDTAHFFAAAERQYKNPKLPALGLVEGPSKKRLRVAVVFDSPVANSCPETRATVAETARLLEKLGHRVEMLVPNVPSFFMDDFKLYWAMMAFMLSSFGEKLVGPGFQASELDGLTRGLVRHFKERFLRVPLAIARLRASAWLYAFEFRKFDVVLSPVLGHTTPKLGYLSPNLPFDVLFDRISKYVSFTPLNNAAGSPAISLPGGLSAEGLPIGVHFSAAHGAERTLLELAYELEGELGFRKIQQSSPGVLASPPALT